MQRVWRAGGGRRTVSSTRRSLLSPSFSSVCQWYRYWYTPTWPYHTSWFISQLSSLQSIGIPLYRNAALRKIGDLGTIFLSQPIKLKRSNIVTFVVVILVSIVKHNIVEINIFSLLTIAYNSKRETEKLVLQNRQNWIGVIKVLRIIEIKNC